MGGSAGAATQGCFHLVSLPQECSGAGISGLESLPRGCLHPAQNLVVASVYVCKRVFNREGHRQRRVVIWLVFVNLTQTSII